MLRPGFIYSWKHRWWSIPLKYDMDAWNWAYPYLANFVKEKATLNRIVSELKTADPIALDDISNTIQYLLLNAHPKRIF